MNTDERPLPKLLKLPEVVLILGISRTSAYRLAANGELPSINFAGAAAKLDPNRSADAFIKQRGQNKNV
jgi:hypothetical protein